MSTKHIDLNNLSLESLTIYRDIYLNSFEEFHEILEKILKNNQNINLLISHSLFSRNNYLSTFYEDFCLLKFLQKIVKNEEKYVVTLSNFQQFFLFNEHFRLTDNVKLIIKSKNTNKLFRFIKIFFKTSLFLYYLKILSFFFNDQKNKNINLISINLIDDMFKFNKFNDRYYNGIDKDLIKSNYLFYPIILLKKNLFKNFKILKKSQYNFFFYFKYLNFTDLLNIQFYFINFLKIKFPNDLKDYKRYLNFIFYSNIIDTNTYFSFINYFSIKAIYRNNFKINNFIIWYENQPVEKGLNFSLYKFFPNCKRIGYKSYFIDNNFHFYIRPTKYEYLFNYVPRKVASNCYNDESDLMKYYSNFLVLPGPLYRFDYFKDIYPVEKINNNKILVSLPIHLDESINILKFLKLFINTNEGYLFYIKPHPFLSINKINKYISSKNMILTIESNQDLFNKCFLIFSNTSSILLEAFFFGLKVAICAFNRKNIQNPLFFLDNQYYHIINNINDFEKCLKSKVNNYELINYEKIKITNYASKNLI